MGGVIIRPIMLRATENQSIKDLIINSRQEIIEVMDFEEYYKDTVGFYDEGGHLEGDIPSYLESKEEFFDQLFLPEGELTVNQFCYWSEDEGTPTISTIERGETIILVFTVTYEWSMVVFFMHSMVRTDGGFLFSPAPLSAEVYR
jgi:hypothetical protein